MITDDIYSCFKNCIKTEKSALGREILGTLVENADIARNEQSPICQDTGMTVVFVTMGQDVHIEGGFIEDAINEGVRRGYTKGYLRKSVYFTVYSHGIDSRIFYDLSKFRNLYDEIISTFSVLFFLLTRSTLII